MLRPAILSFQQNQREQQHTRQEVTRAVVLPYKKTMAKSSPKRRAVPNGRALAAAR